MPDRFFDKIKLFKGAEIQPGRPAAEPGEEEKGQPPGRGLIRRAPGSFSASSPSSPRSSSSACLPRACRRSTGAISPRRTSSRPFDLLIEDAEATRQRKAEAADAILPVYTYDRQRLRRSPRTRSGGCSPRAGTGPPRPPGTVPRRSSGRSSSTSWASISRRADVATLVRLKFPAELEEMLVNLTAKTFDQGIIVAKNLFIHGEAERGMTLLDGQGGERTVRVGDLLDIRESEGRFAADLDKIDLAGQGPDAAHQPGTDLPDLQRHLQQDRDRQEESAGQGRGRHGHLHRQEGPGHRPQGRRGHGRHAQGPGALQPEDAAGARAGCRASPAPSSFTPSSSSPSGAISGPPPSPARPSASSG